MASNKIQDGGALSAFAPADLVSGELVLFGKLAGIADAAAVSGGKFQMHVAGVFEVPKTSSVVFAVGDVAYGKGDGGVNGTNTNPMVGHVIEAAANGTTTVKVRLQSGA